MSGRCVGAARVSEAAWDTLALLVSPWFVIPALCFAPPTLMVLWLLRGPVPSDGNKKREV